MLITLTTDHSYLLMTEKLHYPHMRHSGTPNLQRRGNNYGKTQLATSIRRIIPRLRPGPRHIQSMSPCMMQCTYFTLKRGWYQGLESSVTFFLYMLFITACGKWAITSAGRFPSGIRLPKSNLARLLFRSVLSGFQGFHHILNGATAPVIASTSFTGLPTAPSPKLPDWNIQLFFIFMLHESFYWHHFERFAHLLPPWHRTSCGGVDGPTPLSGSIYGAGYVMTSTKLVYQ